MLDNPPAIVKSAPETEADFRRWVRDEFNFTREQLSDIKKALDYLVKDKKLDEGDHGG